MFNKLRVQNIKIGKAINLPMLTIIKSKGEADNDE